MAVELFFASVFAMLLQDAQTSGAKRGRGASKRDEDHLAAPVVAGRQQHRSLLAPLGGGAASIVGHDSACRPRSTLQHAEPSVASPMSLSSMG